jgi:hypothetical protein
MESGLEKFWMSLALTIFWNAVRSGVAARGGVWGLSWAGGFGAPVGVGRVKQRVEEKIASEDAKRQDHRE